MQWQSLCFHRYQRRFLEEEHCCSSWREVLELVRRKLVLVVEYDGNDLRGREINYSYRSRMQVQ